MTAERHENEKTKTWTLVLALAVVLTVASIVAVFDTRVVDGLRQVATSLAVATFGFSCIALARTDHRTVARVTTRAVATSLAVVKVLKVSVRNKTKPGVTIQQLERDWSHGQRISEIMENSGVTAARVCSFARNRHVCFRKLRLTNDFDVRWPWPRGPAVCSDSGKATSSATITTSTGIPSARAISAARPKLSRSPV
jgi:hypothetical protein